MYWCSSAASARADSRSCPNGFSTTTRASCVSPASDEALHDASEEERRDLEVEDRASSCRRSPRRRARTWRRRRSRRRRTRGAPRSGRTRPRRSSRRCPRSTRARARRRSVDGPVVDRHADDRAVEQPARLEPVQRPEGHHLRQVARDPEHDEHVALRLLRSGRPPRCGGYCRRRHPIPPPTKVGVRGERRFGQALRDHPKGVNSSVR